MALSRRTEMVVVRPEGIRQLLRGSEMVRLLTKLGNIIDEAAGPGHVVTSEVGRHRARVDVATEDFDAMLAEANDRNLTRSIDVARL